MDVSRAGERRWPDRGRWLPAAMGLVALVAAMARTAAAEPLQVGDVTLSLLGQAGAYTGFAVTVRHGGRPVLSRTVPQTRGEPCPVT